MGTTVEVLEFRVQRDQMQKGFRICLHGFLSKLLKMRIIQGIK